FAFGDGGSNRWIARLLPRLPISWTNDELRVGKERYAAADHAPVLIQPNPLAAGRYVVLNSGHTFHEKELSTLNYLLFPRLGDWAVVKVGDRVPEDLSGPPVEAVMRAGFFVEQWGVPEQPEGREVLGERLAPLFQPPARFADERGAYRSPLLFRDGKPVRTADDWDRRRREIKQTWHELMGIS